MNSRRLFYILVAILVLVNGAGIAALVYGDKLLVEQNSKLTTLKVESSSLESVQSSLVQAKKDIDKYSVLEQITKTVIPQEKDQARTVREIVKLAGEAGIPISSISFPSSTLGNKAGAASTPAAGQSTTAGSTTQTQKVEGISNVERLEITVTSDPAKPVLYTDFIAFLSKLEQNRRTSQVSSINIQPLSDNRNRLTFSLVLNVYIEK